MQVLGLGLAWEGGDVKNVAGGGHKVNLLKEELKKYKDDAKKIIMFSDRYVSLVISKVIAFDIC